MQNTVKFSLFTFVLLFMFFSGKAQKKKNQDPLKLAVLGLSHGHSHWIFNKDRADIEIVGIYEPDTTLKSKFKIQYQLDEELFYTDIEQVLEEQQPEAVAAFGSIYHHLDAVKAAAPRGIHVMVEKPLAVNPEHAYEMAALAREHKVHILTNYETSWYPTTEKIYRLFEDGQLGNISRMVFHHGHQGPQEIGVDKEFLEWLTHPQLNGGGALVDFGCYGANIMNYLQNGEKPVSVTAVTRNYKPDLYPDVEDDATILVTYKNAQGIIQASWHWPFNRKDMEVYGEKGVAITENDREMRYKVRNAPVEELVISPEDVGITEDPFSYFRKVVRGEIQVPEFGPYSLENNLLVVEILEAAKKSAKTGETVFLKNE